MSRAPATPGLRELSREFLTFLRYNRNLSPHTLRAYETDVGQFLTHLAGVRGCAVSELTLADFQTDGVRGYLAELHDRGNTRASSARRLAAVRSGLARWREARDLRELVRELRGTQAEWLDWAESYAEQIDRELPRPVNE